MTPWAPLAAALLVLMALAVVTMMVMRVQAAKDAFKARVEKVVAPHRMRQIDLRTTASLDLSQGEKGWPEKAADLFGFDPARQDQYGMKWWLVLALGFGLAMGLRVVAAAMMGGWAWLLVVPCWVFVSRRYFGWCLNRRRQKLFIQFPDALALIVRAVRVGIPVSQSVRGVATEVPAPTGPEFAKLSDELMIGVSLDEALVNLAMRNGLQEYRFFATALSLQNQAGGGLSETLDNLADVIRKRVAIRQKGEALSSEAKTSAMVLAALPFVAGTGLLVLSPAYVTPLFTDPTGNKILAAAMFSLGSGMVMMRTMIRKSLT